MSPQTGSFPAASSAIRKAAGPTFEGRLVRRISKKELAPSADMAVIHLWRYVENRRNYPGLHLTADAEGRKVLVDHFSQLESGRSRETRIHLAPVTEPALRVPNNRGGTARYTTFSQWLVSVPLEATRKEFKVSVDGSTCRLSVSSEQAGCIVGGIADLAAGLDDYCIGGEKEDVLWFWRFDS